MRRHDVVIIGGSLAGASCAMALRGKGIDVGIFDRDRFPRQKVCGEFLSPGAVRCLDRLGVLEEVLEAGAVRVDRGRMLAGGRTIEIPFPAPALGFSRERLDTLLAGRVGVEVGCSVESVRPDRGGFVANVSDGPGGRFEVFSKVVVDAAGKLSRFTSRLPTSRFGVQYHEAGDNGSVLDLEFFDGGYGGSVSVEGGRRNFCFLVEGGQLDRFRRKRGCVVTGRVAYRRVDGEYLAIGDAAGMIDPFCGEGMRHAFESGLLAARVIGEGLHEGCGYDEMRRRYGSVWRASWSRKRTLASTIRSILASPRLLNGAFAFGVRLPKLPSILLRQLWK